MVNGRDLTLPTRRQTSEQDYSDLTVNNSTGGRQHCTSATLTKGFHKEPGRMLSRGRQSVCRRLLHIPKISQNFAG